MAYATQRQLKNQDLLGYGQGTLSPKSKMMAGKSHDAECYFRRKKPNSIPGLRVFESGTSLVSNQSTPTSDESNSPTELNIYKRLLDKPTLNKRLPVTVNDMMHDEGFPSTRPAPEGCISFQKETLAHSSEGKHITKMSETYITSNITTGTISLQPVSISNTKKNVKRGLTDGDNGEETMTSISSCNSNVAKTMFYRHHHKMVGRGKMSKSTTLGPPPPPPLPPERADSLSKHREENELKSAPWFQAGIPREITLEVLSQEPVGAFMVRESTTKSGCYALSLRVPKEYHSRGIAHYLIIRTTKGYKIKGFTKEFTTLTALITHHSVMQELLPCPLSLSKYNPNFTISDTNKDFEDMDTNPDYNMLADFRKMMADLNM